jgi:transcriptional regulator with XRE-family HTH domain
MKITQLRQERLKKGWTLEYVAQQLGISNQAVSLIETGKQKPSYDVLLKLLALFNVEHKNVSQLFTAVGDNDTQQDYSNSSLYGVEKMKELEVR